MSAVSSCSGEPPSTIAPLTQPPLAHLLQRWREPQLLGRRFAVSSGARAFALAGMAQRRPVLAVVPTEPEAEELADDLALFTRAHLIPAWETLPFEHISPNLATMARRSQGRALLSAPDPGMVLVASTRAAVQRLSPSSPDPIRIERGQLVDIGELSRQLAALGYERTDRVEASGRVRGTRRHRRPVPGSSRPRRSHRSFR